ncbi:MAG: GNAT family N-acetyltransferase [Bdellovibrionota bacterium]
MSKNKLKFNLISAKETYPLRQMNLRQKLAVEECSFDHDDDATTFHIGAVVQHKIVSIATFVQEPCKGLEAKLPYRLRGMSTHKEFQGQGLGTELIAFAEIELKERHCDLVWCHARMKAVKFYQDSGFQIIGQDFEIEGIGPHKTMYKVLIPR